MSENATISSNKYTQDVPKAFWRCPQCRKCITLKSLKTIIVVLAAFTASYALMRTLPNQVYIGGNKMLPLAGIELHVFEKWTADDIAKGNASKLSPVMSKVLLYNTAVWCERDNNSDATLKELCELYHDGIVTGSLCPALCDTHHIQVVKCLSVGNRKQVLKVSCNNSCVAGSTVEAFLKTSVFELSETLSKMPDLPADNYLSAATQLVLNSLETFMPFLPFPRQEVLKVMWGDLDLKQANATLRSLLLLLGQAEYVLSRALGQFRIFPQIYGSCGQFYLQESCPALDTPELSIKPWRERATAALGMLEELRKMEAQLPDPIIACDMKAPNFGTCAEGDLRILDVSDVFFNASMSTTRGQKQRCTKHDDCTLVGRLHLSSVRQAGGLFSHTFIACTVESDCAGCWLGRYVSGMNGCQGQCDTDSGACYMAVNENLEFLCRRVFMTRVSHMRSDHDASEKLLNHPPRNVSADLARVLLECENLSHTLKYMPGAGQNIMERLEAVLKRSLEL